MQICLMCGKSFAASQKELNRGNARFCSLSCACSFRNYQRRSQVQHTCEICGKHYSVKTCRDFTSRYCSRKCLDESRVTTGEYQARELAFALLPNKCSHCSDTEDLVLHHIDKNHFNNNPDNWRIVCRRCHVVVEHPEVMDNLNASHL
jgi:hypothetical protein